MSVDKSSDIDVTGNNIKTLDDLDKAAQKAIKSLEKETKQVEKIKAKEEKIQSRQDKKIERKMARAIKRMRKQEVKNFGKKKGLLSDLFGDVGAKNLFSMGKNPKAFFMGVMKAIPFLGGVLAAKEIAEFIVDEIAKIDRFFKKFIDEVDKRVDAFRTLQQQAEVQAGLTQRIITTSSGSTEPRYSYNTFEEFNNNQVALEEKFQMINNSGVE